jgi:hypothetical protein
MNDTAGRELTTLLETDQVPHLGPTSRPGILDESTLRARVLEVLAVTAIAPAKRDSLLSLLLLWHDHLDASHAISQGIKSEDGSFIHAMMHRREPDYWNSKYWWRQTGAHPVFDPLSIAAHDYLTTNSREEQWLGLLKDGVWDPASFVDACEGVADRAVTDPEVGHLRELQRIECQTLLHHLLDG